LAKVNDVDQQPRRPKNLSKTESISSVDQVRASEATQVSQLGSRTKQSETRAQLPREGKREDMNAL
jgi:hypothetical protein